MSIIVMKFGGASVATPESFSSLATIIKEQVESGSKVVAVVSAMKGATDQLVALAKQVHPTPPQREYDMLVSVGERISISLLAMALNLQGLEAISFTGSQAGIITSSQHSDARIVDIRPYRLTPHLERGKIVIVAGFQGVSRQGEITTLGRGGSDTSAVALGVALRAPVEFFKDVGAVYQSDPKLNPGAERLNSLSYEAALAIVKRGEHPVLHPRCIELARRNDVPLAIRSFNNWRECGTQIASKEVLNTTNTPLYEEE